MQVHCVSLESDIANNWPGMQYTAFLVVFPDPYVQGKLFKNKGKTCPFLVHCCQFKCSLSATNKTL